MSKQIIINWKSYKNVTQAKEWLQNLAQQLPNVSCLSAAEPKIELILAPPYPLLSVCHDLIVSLNLPLELAVQDLSRFPAGAYTGEVCGVNLEGFDVCYVLLGHSERRHWLKESSHDVALKVEQAIFSRITPIICLDKVLIPVQMKHLNPNTLAQSWYVYEPRSAIGSGQHASLNEVQNVKAQIQRTYGQDVKVLYGGSVDEFNVGEFLLITDGVILGSAGLELAELIRIIENAGQIYQDNC